jgi:microcystin-dependent protein
LNAYYIDSINHFFLKLFNLQLLMDPIIGQLMLFAGNFAPRGWAFCNGQLISIAQNSALFSLLGTMYGGDGQNTFALPDLRGRTPVGMGQGPGLSNIVQGEKAGSPTVTLLQTQMPAHNHAVPMTGAEVNINTTVTGTIKAGATASGNFPATKAATTGEVDIPVNKMGGPLVNGSNPSEGVLVTLPATTKIYTTAAANATYSGKAVPVTKGEASIPQTPLNLPVSGSVDVPISTKAPVVGNATTAVAGSNQPVGIMSPYLGLNYCIALEGIYPSRQ